MNKKLFWLYLSSMWLSIRLVLFEKYALVLTVLWWGLAFVLAFVLHGFGNGSEFIVLAIAFLVQKRFYRFMEPSKSKLIRVGDRVEFAEDQEEGYIQKFKSAKVLRKMRGEDVAMTGLFSEELIPYYSHFYLIEMDDKNAVIPYEWILSIDLDVEPID
ncbi:MAG: hypothetical protein WBF77_07710 [Sulfurimonadaceae bacterium]